MSLIKLHPRVDAVTQEIINRSKHTREAYLKRMQAAIDQGPHRSVLSCGNLAHGFAACGGEDKARLADAQVPNIGIITAYNDMLSAHQPFADYPQLIKAEAHRLGAVAQVAGGVPAMCDGVTQGQPGMEMSLFSRDTIAQAAAVGLSHNMFDAAMYLGVCDKIVPGLLIAALTFGHLPSVFVPAGPMPSGLPNKEKARIREEYAQGKIGKAELLAAESQSYHSPGTCTFYGTANSNQALVEVMGLHVPGTAFINPGTPLRQALTQEATRMALRMADKQAGSFRPLCQVVDERSIVNALVMLLATGGSTNHTLHWIAVAKAAGIILTWEDMDALSKVTPLLTRVYPNGQADVNHLEAAGGLPFLIRELASGGLLHQDVMTNAGSLTDLQQHPELDDQGVLSYRPAVAQSGDTDVLRPLAEPFQEEGGLRLLTGNLGRAVIKVSAVDQERWCIEAPCAVFDTQEAALEAFKAGELHRDVVVVLRFNGPKANGMPELHKLTPPLGVLQNLGFKVALLTDGRMSGASGKVPAAIHTTPEALAGGALARLQDGDVVRIDAHAHRLDVLVDEAEFAARPLAQAHMDQAQYGLGRELFSLFRKAVGPADEGASVLG